MSDKMFAKVGYFVAKSSFIPLIIIIILGFANQTNLQMCVGIPYMVIFLILGWKISNIRCPSCREKIYRIKNSNKKVYDFCPLCGEKL